MFVCRCVWVYSNTLFVHLCIAFTLKCRTCSPTETVHRCEWIETEHTTLSLSRKRKKNSSNEQKHEQRKEELEERETMTKMRPKEKRGKQKKIRDGKWCLRMKRCKIPFVYTNIYLYNIDECEWECVYVCMHVHKHISLSSMMCFHSGTTNFETHHQRPKRWSKCDLRVC